MSSKQSIWYRLGYALERARSAPPVHRSASSPPSGSGRRQARRSRRPTTAPDRRGGSGRPAGVGRGGRAGQGTRGLAPEKQVRPVEPGQGGRVGGRGGPRRRAAPAAAARRAGPAPPSTGRPWTACSRARARGWSTAPWSSRAFPGPRSSRARCTDRPSTRSTPWAGLYRVLGAHAPLRRVPGLGSLLDELDPHDRVYLEHVTFGIALALLYGGFQPEQQRDRRRRGRIARGGR